MKKNNGKETEGCEDGCTFSEDFKHSILTLRKTKR